MVRVEGVGGVAEHRDGMVSASPADTHSPARAKKKKKKKKKWKLHAYARMHTQMTQKAVAEEESVRHM